MKQVKIILIFVLAGFVLSAVAQTINEAGTVFNEAIQLAKDEQNEAAVKTYEHCINICEQLGEEGEELKMKAQTQITIMCSRMGIDAYKNKKPDEAIAYLNRSYKYAEIIVDKKAMDKATKYLGYVYTYKGNVELKKESYDQAFEYFNQAISYYPNNIKTYYGLGLVYIKKDDEDKMKEAMNKVIAMGKEEDKTVIKAKSSTAKYYLKKATVAVQNGENEETIRFVNESFRYADNEPGAYYYMALANNNSNNFSNAIKAADMGISIEKKNPSNLYFELARAYEGKGDIIKACENYKLVSKGPNVDAAKFQMEKVLKCN